MKEATKKAVKAVKPRKKSDRKRPNKTFIERMAKFRGFMTGNEKTTLATLNVKNVMQRVNNIAMDDDATKQFNGTQNAKIQALIKAFVTDIDAVVKG